jgi:hypothetical protein
MQTQGHEARAQVRAKDVPHINWANLIGKTTKAVKGTFSVIDGEEVGGDQEVKNGILENLEHLIDERHQALAAELMARRDSIVKAWKDEVVELYRLDQQAQT